MRFHGHMCPGLAMGIRAAEAALREVGPHSSEEEVVTLTETDMCAVDAIQYLIGCTFGKGNLIHLTHGKNAYTFIRRSDGKAIRVSTPAGAFARSSEHTKLSARVREGSATEEERARYKEQRAGRVEAILRASEEELAGAEIPPVARIHGSVTCDGCGELTMETRVWRLEDKELCQTCFGAAVPTKE